VDKGPLNGFFALEPDDSLVLCGRPNCDHSRLFAVQGYTVSRITLLPAQVLINEFKTLTHGTIYGHSIAYLNRFAS